MTCKHCDSCGKGFLAVFVLQPCWHASDFITLQLPICTFTNLIALPLHVWLSLHPFPRELWLALLSKQEEVLRVAQVLSQRFSKEDAAVAADEFMPLTAAVRYGFVRGIARQKLRPALETVRQLGRQQAAAEPEAAAGPSSRGDSAADSGVDTQMHWQLPDAGAGSQQCSGGAAQQASKRTRVSCKGKRPGQELVGSRVEVWWDGDEVSYSGRVTVSSLEILAHGRVM